MEDNQDRTARKIYQRIAQAGAYSCRLGSDPQPRALIDPDFEIVLDRLCRIEEFVQDVIASEMPAFRMKEGPFGREVLSALPLAVYFPSVAKFFWPLSLDYKYSARVELFFDCWGTLELDKEGFRRLRGYSSKLGKEPYEIFNDLVHLIRAESQTSTFKRKIYEREKNAARNYLGAARYVNSLYSLDQEIQILKFEFFYRSEHAKDITAPKAKKDLGHFLNNRRSKPKLFASCAGYLWTLQHAPWKGWHFQLFFFYSNTAVLNSDTLAEGIGNYWTDYITVGRGHFCHCNAHRDDGVKQGAMPDARSDETKRILLDEVRYLTGTEQYLRPTPLGSDRCFGRGEQTNRRRG